MEKLFAVIVVGGLVYAGWSLFGKKKKTVTTTPKVGGPVADSSTTIDENME